MKTRTWLGLALTAMLIWPAALQAAQYDLKEITPDVQNALSGRQARYNQLKTLKAAGMLGETHHGYIKVLLTSAEADALAEAENRDRGVIYRAIIRQHGLGPQGLAGVEMAFGDVQRDKAASGEQVQLPSGEWIKKN